MKFMYLSLILMLIAGCLSAQNHAPMKQDSIPNPQAMVLFEERGTSSMMLFPDTIKGNAFPKVKIQNQRYDFLRFPQYSYGNMMMTSIALSEYSEQKPGTRDRGPDGKIVLSAHVVPSKNGTDYRTVTWCDTIAANSIRNGEEFIEAFRTRYSGQTVRSLYRYQDGVPLMTFTSDFYGLEEVKDYNERRYIGFWEAQEHEPDEQGIDTSRDVYGVMTYIDPISLHAQYLILSLNGSMPLAERPDWEHLTGITIRGLKPSTGDHFSRHLDSAEHHEHWAFSDFRNLDIKLTFSGSVPITVHVPVHDDTIDVSHVKSDWFDVALRKR